MKSMTGHATEAGVLIIEKPLLNNALLDKIQDLVVAKPSQRRMPNSVHRLFAASVTACMVAISPVWAQEDASALKRGADLLAANCARCHATGTTGSSPHRDAPAFRTLSQRYPIEGLGEALAEGLSVGHLDMPEFTFESQDVGAILSYLKSIQER
jgi:cytochrome c